MTYPWYCLHRPHVTQTKQFVFIGMMYDILHHNTTDVYVYSMREWNVKRDCKLYYRWLSWLWKPSHGCHKISLTLILSFSLSPSLPLCLSVYSHHWVQVVTVLLLSLYSSVCSYFTLPCVSTSTRHTFFTNWWRCELHTVSSVCACVRACVTGGLLKTLVWPCLRPEGLHWFLETTRRANVC